MIHRYGSKADQTWINMDQRGSSAFSLFLQPSACRRRPDSWLMCHGSWLMRPTCQASGSWLMRPTLQASGVPRVRRQAHGSCVPLTWHASDSWLMRPTHVACVPLTWHASDSWLMRQASDSWLMRPTCQASGVRLHVPHSAPFSRRPLSVMTTTQRRHFPHATPFRFAPIELYGMG